MDMDPTGSSEAKHVGFVCNVYMYMVWYVLRVYKAANVLISGPLSDSYDANPLYARARTMIRADIPCALKLASNNP